QLQHRRLRLDDAAERAREVLVVEQRDRAAERAHAERDRRTRRVLALGIDTAGCVLGIADALDAERPVDQLRERAGLQVAAGAAAFAVLRRDVVRAGRQPRAVGAVAELHVRLALLVRPYDVLAGGRRLAERGRRLVPADVVDAHLQRGLRTGGIRR